MSKIAATALALLLLLSGCVASSPNKATQDSGSAQADEAKADDFSGHDKSRSSPSAQSGPGPSPHK